MKYTYPSSEVNLLMVNKSCTVFVVPIIVTGPFDKDYKF